MVRHEYLPPTRQLIALRAVRGFSQKDVAERLLLSTTAYSRRERGDGLFNLREINALLDMFGVPFEKIFRVRKR